MKNFFPIIYFVSTRIALAMPKSSVTKYSELNALPNFCVLADFIWFRRDRGAIASGSGTVATRAGACLKCTAPGIPAPCLQGTQPGSFAGKLRMSSCETLLHKSVCPSLEGLGSYQIFRNDEI